MMRRGPLADTSIRTLLKEAAAERITGIIELHSVAEGLVYLVDGEVYLADIADREPLQERFVQAGLITQEQLERHTEPGEDEAYLGLALDTDVTIDEAVIARWLLELTVDTIAVFDGAAEGEYELDPYGQHPAGILASWPVNDVLARLAEVEAERAEAEARAAAERAEAEEREAAERAEAEARAAAERAEAEARAEIERLEAEKDAAVEGAGEPDVSDEPGAADDPDGSGSTIDGHDDLIDDPTDDPTGGTSTDSDGQPVDDGEVQLDTLPPPPPATGPAARVLVVTPDTAPADLPVIELEPLEWRIVVIAAQGLSLADLAGRLNLDEAATGELVDGLCERGLLAKVG